MRERKFAELIANYPTVCCVRHIHSCRCSTGTVAAHHPLVYQRKQYTRAFPLEKT